MKFEADGGVQNYMNTDLEAYRIFYPYAVGMDRYIAVNEKTASSPEELRAFMYKNRLLFLIGALCRLDDERRGGPFGDDPRIEFTPIPNGSPLYQQLAADRWELERPRSPAELQEICGYNPADY